MKKFWEKHDLVKIAGIMVLFMVLLTWIIPQGYWSGTELVVTEVTRVGIFDFFTYGLLGMYYFTVLITFLFVLGGFYQVLGKTGGYQKLTDQIAKKLKGKEIIFTLVVSFIIAALAAVINDYFVIIAFLPFIVTILSKMKLDKITGLTTTFGSVLVGIIGSVYSAKIVGINVSKLGLEYDAHLWVKLVLFATSFIIFSVFNVLHLRKNLKVKKADQINDTFVSEEVTKKTKIWPVVTIFVSFIVISILAYLPWESVFKVDIFTTATEWIREVKILEAPVFSYILGSLETLAAFGKWDLFGIQALMILATLILKFVYKINWNDYLTSFGEGLKKSGKIVVLMLIIYNILEFTAMFPIIPTIIDWLMSLLSKFNVILATVAGLITSLFSVEYEYTVQLMGRYFITTYADFTTQFPILLQATYGLAMFFTPASFVLMMGLSYLEISYKDWFKYIWKFLVAMFVVIVILMLIIF
ncbi:MAG: hypothetical protein PHG03_02795 [Bacilli bacterium]|nr:hypothetical protein [Bacilli bacterium]MDD4795469.1 hypothetical protein [Bacilli bacterium]